MFPPTYPAGQGQRLSYQGEPPHTHTEHSSGHIQNHSTSVTSGYVNEQMNAGERSHVPHSTLEGSGWRKLPWRRLRHSPPRLLRMQLVACLLSFLGLWRAVSERVKQNRLSLVTPATAVINIHGKRSLAKTQATPHLNILSKRSS